jgi:hypothetical protein
MTSATPPDAFGSCPAIDFAGDIDVFQIQPRPGQVVTITADGTEGQIHLHLRLFNDRGNLLAAGTPSAPHATSLTHTPQSNDPLFFAINAHHQPHTGRYRVGVTEPASQ